MKYKMRQMQHSYLQHHLILVLLFLTFSTYEVATACALAIEADNHICVVDGQIYDEHGRVNRFMSIEEADMLIRTRAKQSETAANYVKVVGEEDISYAHNFPIKEEKEQV